jgi:hypothetical protein
MHRNLEYLPDVIFHCIVCFRNGKVKPTVLRKAEIEVFILERNNIKLLEWFRILASIRVADESFLANKLKKNGQITAVLPAKVLQVKEIFMRFEYCFSLGIACYVCNRE